MKTQTTATSANQAPQSAAQVMDKPASAEPTAPSMIGNIPQSLQRDGLFCVFRLKPRPGTDKPAKVPYNPQTGKHAKSTDPSTFGPFSDVQNYAEAGYDGIGVGIFDSLAAIDIDHCVEIGSDGKPALTETAHDIVDMMQGAYMEYSPSGRGVRILCLVQDGFAYDKGTYLINNQQRGLEIYVAGTTSKYVSVTGNTWTPGVDLSDRSDQLRAIMDKYMRRNDSQGNQPPTHTTPPANTPPAKSPDQLQAEDRTLIEAALKSSSGEKLRRLLAGNMSDYGNDHSRADMGLCCILAQHTSDAVQIDRILRGSGLMRAKWDAANAGSTYGAITIRKALDNAAEYRKRYDVGLDLDVDLLLRAMQAQEQQAQGQAQPAQAAPQGQAQPKPPQADSQDEQENSGYYDSCNEEIDPALLQRAAEQAREAALREVAKLNAQKSAQTAQAAPQGQAQPPKALPQAAGQAPPKQIPVYSAQYLQQVTFGTTPYLVEDIIAEGVTLVVAAPKTGKSWLALHLSLCLSEGREFLGRRTTKAGVLYLALEDGPRRLSTRIKRLTGGQPVTGNCHFVTEAPTLADGELFRTLDAYLETNPGVKCIIIDTLQKVRGIPRGKNAYAQDYEDLGALKRYADGKGISLIIIHHTNKGDAEADPFCKISGTNGIMGAVDEVMMIEKKKRGDEEAYLRITGRDVEAYDWVIRMDRTTCRWEYLGTEDEIDAIRQRLEYEKDPAVITIKALLDDSPDGRWRGTASALMSEGMRRSYMIGATAQAVGLAIQRVEGGLLEYDGIAHRLIKTSGRGGGDHEFFLPQYANGIVAGADAQITAEEEARIAAEEEAMHEAEVKSFAMALEDGESEESDW